MNCATYHIPVLLNETIDGLNIRPDGVYVDLTFESYVRYRQAVDAVRPLMNDFKILGEYKECTYEI